MADYNLAAYALRAHNTAYTQGSKSLFSSTDDFFACNRQTKKYSTLISYLTEAQVSNKGEVDLSPHKELIDEIRGLEEKIPFFGQGYVLKGDNIKHQIEALKEACYQQQQKIQNIFTEINQKKQDLKDLADITGKMLREQADFIARINRKTSAAGS
ncbi:MAG: hypothetical protein FJZ58_03930 [Chlamydiae bacterium]|nr:hypothetical protein [Chlamydiota bacterium]